MIYLPISLRIMSLVTKPSFDCPNADEATQKGVVQVFSNHNNTKQCENHEQKW